MRVPALLLSLLLLPGALQSQTAAPTLGERVKAERLEIEKLLAELNYPEAMKRAEALLPETRPAFVKTDNKALVQSCGLYLDLAKANGLATEVADSAGAWEKALEYAKTANTLASECYETIKVPFSQQVSDYKQAGARVKQLLEENDARIKELKAKVVLDAGERQELDLAMGVEREAVDDANAVKFFQTYLDVAKRDSGLYTPLVKVMEDKLKGEADQIEAYKAGKGDKTKWVEAVVSTPAYLERFKDKADKARWLYRLAILDPENKKVQHQLDILMGRTPAPPARPVKQGKKG
jgi:hypothetical protein